MLEQLDQFDFHHRLAATTGVALIAFGGPDCGACKHLKRVLETLSDQHPDWFVAEIDAQRDTALAREFEVFHLPSMFLFQTGEYHCPLHAEARPAAIEQAIEHALAHPALEAP